MSDNAIDWSLRTWKDRHEGGYFPNSVEHAGWRIYEAPPDWLLTHGELSPEDVVLEVGCGYGEWMIPLSPMVSRIFGVDIHEAPLAVGRTACQDRDVANVTFVLGDGTTVPFPDGSFSLVYSISVLQHLPRSIVYGYLLESMRVAQEGGRILHHFRNADNVGPYPPLASDIEVDHTGDFSVGWTKSEIATAAGVARMKDVNIVDLGLFLLLIGRK